MKDSHLIFLFCMLLALEVSPNPVSPTDPAFAAQQQQPPAGVSYDPDMLALMARVGGESANMTNYLNTFFTSLKASNVFTKLQGLNAFCFANAGSNGQPFITGQPLMKWNGTFTANDSTGITGNGSTGYADTQFQTSTNQNAGTIYVYLKTDGGTSAFACGSTGSSRNSVIRHNGNANWVGQFNDPNGQSVGVGSVSFPCGVMVTRTSSSSVIIYAGSSSGTNTTATSTTAPGWNIYLCGDDNNPTLAGAWSGRVQGWACSTNTLTGADKVALDTAFAALRTSMGN